MFTDMVCIQKMFVFRDGMFTENTMADSSW